VIQLLNFISSIALLLYAAVALIVLFAIRSWWLAQHERRRTIYGLEKEVAGERALRALVIALLAMAMGTLVYFADTNAVPVPAAPQRSPTPNLALFITPTATVPPPSPTPAPPTPTPLRGGQPAGASTPTITAPGLRATSTSPPSPPTPVPVSPACPNPQARIVAPGDNSHLNGVVNIVGSASIANFQYYKIEYGAGEHPSNWNVIGDLRRNQVSEGVLQTFNAAAFPPGVYYLRLTVVDLTGNFPIAPCAVRVFIGS
jgi:hypothetical protein